MKIVVPLSKSDIHLLEPFLELYIALGGTPRQNVIFLPTSGVLPQAKIAADRISPYAKSSGYIPWENDNIQKWPFAGNTMWQHAVVEMANQEAMGDIQPWYFMELDNTALKPFGDALEAEYAVSGCRYMGAESLQRMVNQDGSITTFPADDELKPSFMVGTGIYPPGVIQLTDGVYRNAKFEPWDTFLVHYFRRSFHKTNLIQHRWKTINYREENGVIVCDNDPTRPLKLDNAGPIDDSACVVHGCKDGSLARLVLSKLKSGPARPFVIPSPQLTETKLTPPPEDQPKIQYDKSMWQETNRKEAENGVVLPELIENPKTQPPTPIPTPEPKKKFNFKQSATGDTDKVVECIQNSSKKLMLSQVSKLTKIPLNRLKALCDSPDAQFKASGPAKWVSLVEATA
jgi:hypothetical protein